MCVCVFKYNKEFFFSIFPSGSADIRIPGLFFGFGLQRPVDNIMRRIRLGDVTLLEYLRENSSARQCAGALMTFLKSLHKPLLPTRVQDLLIGKCAVFCIFLEIIFVFRTAENPKVSALQIARDALGLLQQDVKKYDIDLVCEIFKLMRLFSTAGSLRPTEMNSSFGPHLLLPLMFKTEMNVNDRHCADDTYIVNRKSFFFFAASTNDFGQLE